MDVDQLFDKIVFNIFIMILYISFVEKKTFRKWNYLINLVGMQPRGENVSNVSKVKENQTEMALASIINLYV